MEFETLTLDGEAEHHFEYLLERAERNDGQEITAQWLAERLLEEKVTAEYINAIQGNQKTH